MVDPGMLASEDKAINADKQLSDDDLKGLRTKSLERLYDKRALEKLESHAKTNSIQQRQINKTLLEDNEYSLQVFCTNLK